MIGNADTVTLDGSITRALTKGMFVYFRPMLEVDAYLVHVGQWRGKRNVVESRRLVPRRQVQAGGLAFIVDELVDEVAAAL